jgi:epoxyqueuosine reductase
MARRNFHGEMQWMEREPEKRADPRLLFPGSEIRRRRRAELLHAARTRRNGRRRKGKISRYAWGDDYHDVLKEKLRELFAFIKSIDETAEGKICVDTAPMMDKAWAARAGLGWIGKHSNLITKEYGSWVFLGEIFLNLELEYDAKSSPTIAEAARDVSTPVRPMRLSQPIFS